MKSKIDILTFGCTPLCKNDIEQVNGGGMIKFLSKVAGAIYQGIIEVAKSEPIRPSQYLHPDPNSIDRG